MSTASMGNSIIGMSRIWGELQLTDKLPKEGMPSNLLVPEVHI